MPLPKSILYVILLAALLLAGCTPKASPTPASTPTYNPCAPENIRAETKKVGDVQRVFDDAVQLASVTPFSQLPVVIPSMQAARRQAQDLQVPDCLAKLKTMQLTYMEAVINTFLAFLAGGSQNPNTQILAQGIAQARLLRDAYNQELARLIGATYLPLATQAGAASPTVPAATSTP